MRRIITDAEIWNNGDITFFTDWQKQGNKICFTLSLEEILTYISKALIKKRKREKKNGK